MMLYATHESNKCGSDWTIICRDLKTPKGIANRLKRGVWPKGIWTIFVCTDDNFYAVETHRQIGVCQVQ